MHKRIVLATLLCSVGSSVYADEAENLSGSITLASQYVSRGFQQSWGGPALQGGLEYASTQGWYAGSWVSTVSPRFIEGGHAEVDIYAGKRGNLGDVQYHVALYEYVYPGAKISAVNVSYNYAEWVMGIDWRSWWLTYSLTVSRDYFGDNSRTLGLGAHAHSRGSGYLDLGRSIDLGQGYSLTLHYGWQRVNHFPDYSWQDASIGVSHSFGGFDLTLAYAKAWNRAGVYRNFGTGVPDKHGRLHVSNPTSGSVYVTLSRSF